MLKIERISDTCVSNVNMDRREVRLEGHETVFSYEDDSMILLLQKAMTRKATFITKDGVISWIELENNVPTNAYTEVLKESERRFTDLAEHSPNMVFMSQKNRIVYVNKRCEEIIGYKKEEFYSPDFNRSLLFTPEWRDKAKSVRRRLLKGEKIGPLEFELVTKEGRKIDAILTSKLIEFEGELTILGIVTDITEAKAIEKSLSEIDEKYHLLTNNVPVDVWTIDSKDNPIFINPNIEKMLGFTQEEIRQRGNWSWHERTHPEDRQRVTEAYNLFFTRRKTGDIEYRIQRKDGIWIWIHDRVTKIYEKDGVLYADGITWEIIEGKKTE